MSVSWINLTAASSMSLLKKGNTELLNEINYAIDQMNAVEGDWKTALYNKIMKAYKLRIWNIRRKKKV